MLEILFFLISANLILVFALFIDEFVTPKSNIFCSPCLFHSQILGHAFLYVVHVCISSVQKELAFCEHACSAAVTIAAATVIVAPTAATVIVAPTAAIVIVIVAPTAAIVILNVAAVLSAVFGHHDRK